MRTPRVPGYSVLYAYAYPVSTPGTGYAYQYRYAHVCVRHHFFRSLPRVPGTVQVLAHLLAVTNSSTKNAKINLLLLDGSLARRVLAEIYNCTPVPGIYMTILLQLYRLEWYVDVA